MRIKEVLTEEEDKLIEYWRLSKEVSKRIKEKYDMLMQELIDEGYDIDEHTRYERIN